MIAASCGLVSVLSLVSSILTLVLIDDRGQTDLAIVLANLTLTSNPNLYFHP